MHNRIPGEHNHGSGGSEALKHHPAEGRDAHWVQDLGRLSIMALTEFSLA